VATIALRILNISDIGRWLNLTAIISIVGRSNSGKTTFLKELIPEMKQRGYKIATIKHNPHDFEIDKPGKDSWEHRQAGAERVIVSSKHKLAMVRELNQEVDLDDIINNYIDDEVDLIITEGYKSSNKPKVEVFRAMKVSKPLFSLENDDILAIVENKENDEEKFATKEVKRIADLIEEQVVNN
jgi:molybdopterin-guanine dinucleotide biosynthesis protein B